MNKQWHGGKGSAPRPKSVSDEEYANRWDAIFSRDLKEERKNEDGEILMGKPIIDLDKDVVND